MKNNLREYLIVLFFILKISVLFSQTSFDGSASIRELFFVPNPNLLYIPDNSNAFSIQEKSDFKFSLNHSIGTSIKLFNVYANEYYTPKEESRVLNFNIGCSPFQHFYFTSNFLIANLSNSYFSTLNSKIAFGDIGIGSYCFRESKNNFMRKSIFSKDSKWMMPQKGMLLNASLGYGRGGILHEFNRRTGFGKFKLNKFYGQVGFDYQARWWGVASSLKIGVLNYGLTYLEGHAVTQLSHPVEVLSEKNNFNFLEFNFRFYVGMKYGQIYLSRMKTKVDVLLKELTLSSYWSVGTMLDIQEIFRKKNKNEK